MAFINFNGKILENHTPVIEAGNRGLRYGDGLFETMKFKNGNLILVDEHLSRLWSGMKLLQFELPKLFTPDKIEEQILQLIQKNKLQSARIRLTIIRDNGGLHDPESHTPHYLIETWSLPESNGALNENGLDCCLYHDALKTADMFSNSKHNNFLPYFMGALHAKKEKCNDAIILNQYHRICDSTIANVFLIKDDVVYTPSLTEGCIAGVMRSFVITAFKKNNTSIVEKEISIEDLLHADEVFLTNSIYNMRWVKGIESSNYSNSKTREIYQHLFQTNGDVFC